MRFADVFRIKLPVFRRYLLAVELLALWWSSVVYAADISFEVDISTTYDSNVFRSSNTPKGDFYFTLAPEVDLKLPLNKVYFSSNSRVAIEQYVTQTDANLQELVLSGLGHYNPSDYMSFELRDNLIISRRLKSAEKLTDVTETRQFVDNGFLSAIKYELKEGVLTTSLGYNIAIRDYRYTEKDDWLSHSGQLQVEHSFGHKTLTQVSFGLMRKAYEVDVDYISIPIAASLKRKLSTKLNATFSLGLESRRYNEVHQDRDWDKPTVSLDIAGRFTPNTDSRLLLQRKIYDSDFATGYAFASTAGNIALTLTLSDATQLTLRGLYSRNGYIQIERTDSVFGGRGAIQHNLSRWGAVVLGYGCEWRISSVTDNGYKRHTIDLYYVATF